MSELLQTLLDASLKRLGENDEEIMRLREELRIADQRSERIGQASARSTAQAWAEERERLIAVAVAAKALVETAHDYVAIDETSVSEPALTALESALEAAGYGLTDDEGVESESP